MATASNELTTVRNMNEAGSKFVESLDAQQRAKATYPYLDGERVFWYYPPLNRHGPSPSRHG